MSLQSWREEFYPVLARDFAGKAVDDPIVVVAAFEHSYRKWRGLTKKNVSKHGLYFWCGDFGVLTERGDHLGARRCAMVGTFSCALCILYKSHCDHCILQKHGYGCCYGPASPTQWYRTYLESTAAPMLAVFRTVARRIKQNPKLILEAPD